MLEYENWKRRFNSLKRKTLNKVLGFGKYKGRTIQYVLTYDKAYLYWLLRETNINIDPELLGLDMPTRQKILNLLNLKYCDGKFIYKIIYPAIYDNWNVGHYGCTSPTCIQEEKIERYEYSFDDILSNGREYIDKLKTAYPYIKWTKEYLKSLFNENSRK